MELDDDMILIIVGDGDSPNTRPLQEVLKQENKDIDSDERGQSQSSLTVPSDDKGRFLLVSVKEERVDLLEAIKEEPDDCKLEYQDLERFLEVHEATQSFVEAKPCVRRHSRSNILFEDSASSDDFIPPSSWYKTVRKAKPNRKYNVAELPKITKKEQQNKLENSAVSSEYNNSPSSEFRNDRKRSKKNPKSNKAKLAKQSTTKMKKKKLRDPAVSSDSKISSSSEFQNARRMVNSNTNFRLSIKEENNEHSTDSDNANFFRQFENPRRSYNPNPKSHVAELIKQRPQLADDREALVDALVEVMRQVRPPTLPQDYYIINNIDFECMECGHLSETVPVAARHYQEKHGPRYLICFACGVDFRSTTNLYKHEKHCIARDAHLVLRARARLLGAKGRTRPYLSQDLPKAPTKPAKREFPCAQCTASFASQAGLNAHTNYHLGLRPYVCDECGLAYASRCSLSKHKKKHSTRQFICDHCARGFFLKSSLVSHMDTHQLQPKFLCSECPQRFGHRAALNMHVRRLHRRLPLPCVCTICRNRYPRMWALKQHMLREHGLTLMTRKMFYRQLPTMTATQLMAAKVLVKDDVENIDSENEGLLEERSEDAGEAAARRLRDEQNVIYLDSLLQENVDK